MLEPYSCNKHDNHPAFGTVILDKYELLYRYSKTESSYKLYKYLYKLIKIYALLVLQKLSKF